MLFNSFEFLLFFPIVTGLYFLLPHRWRWLLLLAASCVFYMAFIPIYIFILGVTILIDYSAGIWIEGSSGRKRTTFLTMSIISTCAVLFVFKYFNFFNTNLAVVFHAVGRSYPVSYARIILPIGLSFHTFQSLAYVVEVYRGRQKAEHRFGIYALYVMFYPQLVAGPIERPQNLIHQFYEKHEVDYRRITDGLKLMAWGLFKKVVIADRLAVIVNHVYGSPRDYTGLSLLIATFFFAYQIYCDFSGYSDIAIGAAQVMGFKLMTNFQRPYYAKSISEFWKRWHISLSTWFRDYLYISLGGNRVSIPRWYLNLFITFVVSGLWHGANWTFVIWGALNGFYLIVSIWTGSTREKVRGMIGLNTRPLLLKCWQVLVTFSLTCFAWVFFRANNLADAVYVITHLFSGLGSQVANVGGVLDGLGMQRGWLGVALASIVFLEAVQLAQRGGSVRAWISRRRPVVRWAVYYGAVMCIVTLGVFGRNQFIYFQF